MRSFFFRFLFSIILYLAGTTGLPLVIAQQRPQLDQTSFSPSTLSSPAAGNFTSTAFSAKLRQGAAHLESYVATRRYGLEAPPWPLWIWISSTLDMMPRVPLLHHVASCAFIAPDLSRVLSRLKSRIDADRRLAAEDGALLASFSADLTTLNHLAERTAGCTEA